jgi:hypothetical protein
VLVNRGWPRVFSASRLVQPASIQLPLLDPELLPDLGIVATHLLDEALGVLAANEDLERVTQRELGESATSTTA